MPPRASLLARLAALFRRTKPNVPPATPVPRAPQARSIEPLEGRIAPAALLDARTISFTDLDGDLVTVKFSKDLFNPALTIAQNRLDQIFTFTDGTTASPFSSTGPQQLQLLDLTKVPVNLDTFISNADGTSIIINAVTAGGGDGLTKVGAIEANNIVLGTVRVDGDLGQIDCGRNDVPVGLGTLVVNSLFKFGAATQLSTTAASDALESRIVGQLGTLRVATNLHGHVHTVDGTSIVDGSVQTTAPARIGTVFVGGSIIGNPAVAATSNNTGLIESQRGIGTVQVLGTGDGTGTQGLLGGGGTNSGTILAGLGIGTVTIADSLVGGGGTDSGAIITKRGLAAITIGDDLVGGAGLRSGSIQGRALSSVTLTGDVQGGAGDTSGAVISDRGIASVIINGSVLGAGGANSGGITAGVVLTSALVRGSVTGGDGFHSGYLESLGSIGVARVLGAVTGDDGDRSGTIMASGAITTVVAGELVGGAGPNSGSIFCGFDGVGDITTAAVNRGMTGGTGISSGSIIGGAIGSLRVGTAAQAANVQGGAGAFSGAIVTDGTLGAGRIFGALLGGSGASSGAIIVQDVFAGGPSNDLSTLGNIGTLTITGKIAGGTGEKSGRIAADLAIVSLQAAALEGGAGLDSGSIAAGLARTGGINSAVFTGGITSVAGSVEPSIVATGRIGTLTTGGAIVDATIRAGLDIGAITINGAATGSTISATGTANPTTATGDLAIGRVVIRGDVTNSQILAGYDTTGAPVNADASIGTVRVIGNWTASSVAAGVRDSGSPGFGDAGDTKITGGTDRGDLISQIAAINISGTVAGTATGGDHFGFVAQRIVAFRASGAPLAFTDTPGQSFELGTTGDVTAREVPL
jgi:hypothetical protein